MEIRNASERPTRTSRDGARRKWLFALGAAAGAAAGAIAVQRSREGDVLRWRIERLRWLDASHGKSIVILGAGFGGINVASHLLRLLPPETGWTVTLVDRHNYFLFTPLLYHAATGLVDPTDILFPTRSLSRQENYVFRESTVRSIDLAGKIVHLDDGELPYDILVIALGSVTNFFGKQEALRGALTLKNLGDAFALRNRIIDAYERAEIERNDAERHRCLTFAVVGGGATGVELAGAIRGLVHGTLTRQYPRVRPSETRILLFEAQSRILPTLPESLSRYALCRLRELGVEVRLECPIDRVEPDGLLACHGEYIPARTVVWAAGVQPSPLAPRLGLPTLHGRIRVNEYLEAAPGVYALGDIAACIDPATGQPLPPNAAVAVQQARALADILVARLEKREPEPFRYVHRGELVSLGRHEAVAEIGGVHITGFPAWLIWRAFYLSQLMGFKNRLLVALDWTFAYFYARDTVRLDVGDGTPGAIQPEVAREAAAAAR